MANADKPVLAGQIVEEELTLSLTELCATCAVDRQRIIELVEQGLLDLESGAGEQFRGAALRRVRIALRLERDLGINAAGASLVVELLERIEALETRNRRLAGGA